MDKEQIIEKFRDRFGWDKENIEDFLSTHLPSITGGLCSCCNKMGIEEGEINKICTDVAFRWKEDAMRNKKQSENIWIDIASALSTKFSQPGVDEKEVYNLIRPIFDKLQKVVEPDHKKLKFESISMMLTKEHADKVAKEIAKAIINSMGKGGNDG